MCLSWFNDSKGYLCYNMSNHRIYTIQHAIFDETSVPFASPPSPTTSSLSPYSSYNLPYSLFFPKSTCSPSAHTLPPSQPQFDHTNISVAISSPDAGLECLPTAAAREPCSDHQYISNIPTATVSNECLNNGSNADIIPNVADMSHVPITDIPPCLPVSTVSTIPPITNSH